MNKPPDQLSLNVKLDDSVSLEKFIKCESNNSSLEFLKSSISEDSISNLFYIWGSEGVGKSYIMQALNKEFTNLDKKTLHLSLGNSKITSHEIFQNLGSLDVLLIEKIEKLPVSEVDGKIEFNDILAYGDDKIIEIGTPMIQGSKVEANLIKNSKNRTVLIFKKRRRQNSRRKNGHRQEYSLIKINKIFSRDGKVLSEAEKISKPSQKEVANKEISK